MHPHSCPAGGQRRGTRFTARQSWGWAGRVAAPTSAPLTATAASDIQGLSCVPPRTLLHGIRLGLLPLMNPSTARTALLCAAAASTHLHLAAGLQPPAVLDLLLHYLPLLGLTCRLYSFAPVEPESSLPLPTSSNLYPAAASCCALAGSLWGWPRAPRRAGRQSRRASVHRWCCNSLGSWVV